MLTTKAEARKRVYGRYKIPYKEDNCCESVTPKGMWSGGHQCNRSNGHGPEGLYCKQHDPAKVAERRKKSQSKWDADRVEWRKKAYGPKMYEALRQIAAGHNDARQLAKQTLEEIDD